MKLIFKYAMLLLLLNYAITKIILKVQKVTNKNTSDPILTIESDANELKINEQPINMFGLTPPPKNVEEREQLGFYQIGDKLEQKEGFYTFPREVNADIINLLGGKIETVNERTLIYKKTKFSEVDLQKSFRELLTKDSMKKNDGNSHIIYYKDHFVFFNKTFNYSQKKTYYTITMEIVKEV
jgi:hypothetical protein